MLSDRLSRKLAGIETCSKQGHKVRRLFNIMPNNPELWQQAYANLDANHGALTKGIEATTMDGFSDERAANLMTLLKEDRYDFQPSRRVYIPKANGRTRPLGIPSGNDKLVQEVARLVLEKVYEPVFSETSHGFRPCRSCHTALEHIQQVWTGTRWWVEVDIEGYFNNINHTRLIQLLAAKIDDRRFIQLIKKMLKAGYMENWKFYGTYSGTPQGGPISPMLANVYLHELDTFMENMQRTFNTGDHRRANPAYNSITLKIHRLRKKVDALDIQSVEADDLRRRLDELDQTRKTLPSGDPYDPQYKRVHYLRYADDILVGLIGSKQDAQMVMAQVTTFLQARLNLSISEDKSGIQHGAEGVTFLGYEVKTYSDDKVVKMKIGTRQTKRRTVSQKMDLHVPARKLKDFCHRHGYGRYDMLQATHRSHLLAYSDYEIISIYNAELRGLANYYALADDTKRKMQRLAYLWLLSLLKTLASKHKTTIREVTRQLKRTDGYVYSSTLEGKQRVLKVFQLKDLKLRPKTWSYLDRKPVLHKYKARTEILARMQAQCCEYCGQHGGDFEVHHVRKLADSRDGKEPWQRLMSARQRKTLVLCVECHNLLHAGQLPSWRRAMYEEVESRMP